MNCNLYYVSLPNNIYVQRTTAEGLKELKEEFLKKAKEELASDPKIKHVVYGVMSTKEEMTNHFCIVSFYDDMEFNKKCDLIMEDDDCSYILALHRKE